MYIMEMIDSVLCDSPRNKNNEKEEKGRNRKRERKK